MKIGKSRIAVVIGKNGETKEEIEKQLGVNIILDSKTGYVEIRPDVSNPNYQPYNPIIAEKIIKAINRGFNPIKAMQLTQDTYDLEVFNLMSIIGRSKKRVKQVKGRIIGRNGEMRKAIEQFTGCYLSVYGKTASILGEYDELQIARKAVNMLISGMPHHTVLQFLENKYNEKKKEQFRQMYKPEF